jgi:hypothetical protein
MREGLNKGELKKEKTGPIIVCIGSPQDFGFIDPKEKSKIFSSREIKESLGLTDAKNVDQDSGLYDGKENFLTVGPSTYIISPIDNEDKFSENFHRCTGLVVAGIDKKTGKNISFLSHQDPSEFLYKYKDKFIEQLKRQLIEIKERCERGTVTISTVIVGGRYFSDDELDNYQVVQLYNDSVKLLGKIVKEIFEFEPTIVNGPKTSRNEKDDVYFDNKNRRLYLIRTKVNSATEDFTPSNVDDHEKTWK